MTSARTLVKPYWIRIGSGGFAIETDKDLVRAFFGEMDRGAENQRAFELISTNPYGNLRARGYYWDAAYIEHEIVGKGGGLVMIPGDWPEPKDGPVWEHVVPFTPQPTACKAGKAEAHPGVAYRVRQGEQPWDVAMRFGQPYKAWVKLRQANHDDPAGFVRPAKDAGICTFADWRAGKWISIPKDWPLPEPQSPLWRDMTMARALGAVGAPNTSEALPPRKDTPMQPQTFPYRIQRGDTPGLLAGRHGVTKDDLFRANPKMLTMRDRFGDKNFHPLSFQRGAVMNIPVPSGSVSAPSGAVGGITSPMATFKGASGLTAPTMTFYDWPLKHPQWNGTNEAYWSQRIVATASRVPGLIDRPNLQAYVLAFLRSYPNVGAFKAAMQTANYTQPLYPSILDQQNTVYPDEGMWYAEPQDRNIAYIAAVRLAALPGMAIGAMNGPSGNVSAPSGNVGFQVPRMRGYGLKGFQVAPPAGSGWGDKHPQWNGTNEAYWSQRVMIQAQRNRLPGVTSLTVLPFLRSFSSTDAFREAMLQDYVPQINIFVDYDTWYASPTDPFVALNAARKISAIVASVAGAMNGPTGAVGCGGGGCGYGLERSRRPYEQQGCQCGSPGYCPSCGRDGALGACQCGQGYIGAPNGNGAVGAAGDPCPGGAAIADVKPYHYVVTADDVNSFWMIPTKFGMPTKMGTKWTWQQMRDANKGWVGGVALDAYGACVLQGLYEGAKLLVPASWGEPQPGATVVPIGTDNKCQPGYFEMGGQCVQLPPGTSLPIGGQCPAGTTNVAGICVPNLGYPMPQGGCLPGTTLDPADGMCKPPGGGGGEITFGVPPDSNGQCPTGMRLYSDNLCYVPGKQPSGLKLVTQTTDAEDDGIPTWVWVVGGIGAAAAAVGIAMMAGKKPDKKKPAREPEFFVEEEEVIG